MPTDPTPLTDAQEARQTAEYERTREAGDPPFPADFDFARDFECRLASERDIALAKLAAAELALGRANELLSKTEPDRLQFGGMEMEISELRAKLAEAEKKTILAERCYAEDRCEMELYNKLVEILGDKVADCWTDGYDGSVEVVSANDAPWMTREQADLILALGFGKIYESHYGEENGVNWMANGRGQCSARTGGKDRQKWLKSELALSLARAKGAEMLAVLKSCGSVFDEMESVIWNDDSDFTSSSYSGVADEVSTLLETYTLGQDTLAELKALREDKERMDWLEKHGRDTAGLAEFIASELKDAKSAKRKAQKGCAAMAVEYWTGYIVAMKAIKARATLSRHEAK